MMQCISHLTHTVTMYTLCGLVGHHHYIVAKLSYDILIPLCYNSVCTCCGQHNTELNNHFVVGSAIDGPHVDNVM